MAQQQLSLESNLRKNSLIALAIATVCCVASALWIDIPLAYWIRSVQNSWTLEVGSWLEEAGKSHWAGVYSMVVVAIAWHKWRSVARKHLAFFFAIAVSGLVANIIKIIVCRSRPPLLIEQGIAGWDLFAFRAEYLWNSFPSGHATTGIAIAVAGSIAIPKLRYFLWPVGLAIAFGRLLYNVHYLSDVLAGIAIGLVVSLIATEQFKRPRS